jgi:hypothetical protein
LCFTFSSENIVSLFYKLAFTLGGLCCKTIGQKLKPLRTYMNTKLVMLGATIVLGVAGLTGLFLPQVIFNLYDPTATGLPEIVAQLLGSAFLGFAALNWVARYSMLGGIYGRAIVVGNFMHFEIGTLLSVRTVLNQPNNLVSWLMLLVYGLFGVAFGVILFVPHHKHDLA